MSWIKNMFVFNNNVNMYYKYKLIHIFLGCLSNLYPIIDIYFFGWQIFQFLIGKKIFLFEMLTKDGNNFYHTIMKLSEYMFGKLLFRFI